LTDPGPILAQLLALIHPWGCLWGLPGFEQNLTLRFSPRLTRSLGRCNPATGVLTLRRGLPADQIPSILCHEAAHIAVFLRFGTGLRPHGPEWASLVALAGFLPAVHAIGPQPQPAPAWPLPLRPPMPGVPSHPLGPAPHPALAMC